MVIKSDKPIEEFTPEEVDNELVSKIKETKRLSKLNENKLIEIGKANWELRRTNEMNRQLLIDIDIKKQENETLLKKLKESTAWAVDTMSLISMERESLEKLRLSAIAENSSAEYNKNLADHLRQLFRNELHRYIQIAWTGITIPNLTKEHKIFIIKTLEEELNPKPITDE